MKKEKITKIGLWYGKPIESLSKKELLEVIKFMTREIERLEKERKSPDQLAEELFKAKFGET